MCCRERNNIRQTEPTFISFCDGSAICFGEWPIETQLRSQGAAPSRWGSHPAHNFFSLTPVYDTNLNLLYIFTSTFPGKIYGRYFFQVIAAKIICFSKESSEVEELSQEHIHDREWNQFSLLKPLMWASKLRFEKSWLSVGTTHVLHRHVGTKWPLPRFQRYF